MNPVKRPVVFQASGPFLRKLQAALEEGQVPSLDVRFFTSSEGRCGESGDFELRVSLTVFASGQSSSKCDASIVSREVRSVFATESGRLSIDEDEQPNEDVPAGILDLFLNCLSGGLSDMYPQFAEAFQSVLVESFSVNSSGTKTYKVAMATLGFDCNLRDADENEKQRSRRLQMQRITCQGVDTNYAAMQCMIIFYNWLLWKLLRREHMTKQLPSAVGAIKGSK